MFKKLRAYIRKKRATSRYWVLGLSNPALLVLLALVFIYLLVQIMVPGDIPVTVSVKANTVAKQDIKATRDFSILEKDPTAEAKMEAAVATVPVYYVHDTPAKDLLIASIHETFQLNRDLLAAKAAVLDHHDAISATSFLAPKPLPEEATTGKDEPEEIIAKTHNDILASIHGYKRQKLIEDFDTKLENALVDFKKKLGVDVSDKQLKAIVNYGFSKEIEDVLVGVVEHLSTYKVVELMDVISEKKERGVIVTNLGTDVQSSYTELGTFIGKAEAMVKAENVARAKMAKVSDPKYSNKTLLSAVVGIARELVSVNCTFDDEAYSKAKETAKATIPTHKTTTFLKDEVIVSSGEKITDRDVKIIEQMQAPAASFNRVLYVAVTGLFAVLVCVFVFFFSRRHMKRVCPRRRDVVFFATILVAQLALTRFYGIIASGDAGVLQDFPPEGFFVATPFAMGAMFLRLFVNSHTAIVYSILSAILNGLIFASQDFGLLDLGGSYFMGTYVLVSSLMAITAMGKIRKRVSIHYAGFFSGLANMAIVGLLMTMFQHDVSMVTLEMAVAAFVSGITSAFLLAPLSPIFEGIFSYTTDIKLLELGSFDHPLLKELAIQAPGTYNHSIIVANMAEGAAEVIDANPLLAKTATYFHDIGKTKTPQYFAENQTSRENRHDKLTPNMSALILKAHVKDGIKLAKKYRLGKEIMDIIEQHQGTTLIKFFYFKAVEAAKETHSSVNEEDYRYPGPKPQTKEAGIILLADSSEAAVKSLSEKSPAKIKGMVKTIINDKFNDGQLEECELTLKDLHLIEGAFVKVLNGIYHHRPEYPDQKRADQKTGERRAEHKTDPKLGEKRAADTKERERILAMQMRPTQELARPEHLRKPKIELEVTDDEPESQEVARPDQSTSAPSDDATKANEAGDEATAEDSKLIPLRPR